MIGIGASAGDVEALTSLVKALPADLPAAILVVLHTPSSGTSALPSILGRAGRLPAAFAAEGARLRAGTISVAPADRHLTVEDGALHLRTGPRENGHRPAIDPLLTSLAAYGARGVGVILSGTRDDGSRGMLAIKEAGGTTFVQDPEEALFDGMIRSAQRYVKIDAVLRTTELASALSSRADALAPEDARAMDEPEIGHGSSPEDDRSATRYTCPDCGGALWRHTNGHAVTFRCSVGHAYSPTTFDDVQGQEIENALWAAARLLGDRKTLLEELARSTDAKGHDRVSKGFRAQAEEIEAAATTIRGLIESGRLPLRGTDVPADGE